jgi:hypothetical protein
LLLGVSASLREKQTVPKFTLSFLLVFALLAGCAKQAALPDTVVHAASPGEFARFRADLGTRFPPEQLQDFDTAGQELQLDAMHRDIATAAGREADMLAAVNGQTVHAVTLLGWQARKARFLRELAEITRMLEHDLKQAEKAPPSESLTRRIGSEKDVQAKLQRNLAETDRRLAELGATNPH